jgi:hypothetical protein
MKIDRLRGPIRGTAYDGWFQVDSIQWGAGLGISSARRRTPKKPSKQPETEAEIEAAAKKERTCSDPSYSEMTVSKAADGFSAYLMHGLPIHQCFEKVVIEVVNLDGFVVQRWYVHIKTRN